MTIQPARSTIRISLWISFLLLFSLIQSNAQSEIPGIERFMQIRAPGNPSLGPDGTLYVRDWPDGVNQIYRRAADQPINAHMEQLTDFEDGVSGYSLSPGGRHIVFWAAIGGSEQNDLYHLDPGTGEITPLFTDPSVVYGFQTWLHDESGFVYTANDDVRTAFHIYRYDFEHGDATKLLDHPGMWGVADVTTDGARYLIHRFTSISHADVYELNSITGELKEINIANGAFNIGGGYITDERSVIVLSDSEEGIRRLFIRDLENGEIHKPLPQLDPYDIEGGTVDRDRRYIAVSYNKDGYGRKQVFTLPAFKPVSLPDIEPGIISNVSIQGDRVIWRLSNARTPGLTFAANINQDDKPQQLTVADTQEINLHRFRLPELITYRSFDGLEIPAFIYLPPDYEPGAGIPFIADYHGGPESQFRPGFNPMIQYLLANGFGVIQPNVRGSTGYGREFHMLDNYTKRWDSVRDGVEAVRWLVENGYTEPGRVAAYGGSYGGFMAVATVIEGQELYGASVNIVGIVNFVTFLEQTADYRRALREAEYGPLSDREFLESVSPINMVDRINVPMMIVHGLNDPRVPVGEAMQLAVALQKRRHDPEQLYFPDEGHGLAKLENRLLFAERLVRFLERHIGK